MSVYLCFVVALVAAILSTVVKKTNPEMGLCIAIAAVASIFFLALDYIENVLNNINELELIDTEIFTIPIKMLGLTIMSKISSSICEDCGEKGLSTAIQTVTKFACVFIAFPLFEELIALIREVLMQ